MKVKELIKEILKIDRSQSENLLKGLRKVELEEIHTNLSDDKYDEDLSENFKKDALIDGLKYDEDYVGDPTIERPIVDKDAGYDFGLEYEEEDEEIVIDISKLSKYEQRHYAKTGQIPQITINRYTRFDD